MLFFFFARENKNTEIMGVEVNKTNEKQNTWLPPKKLTQATTYKFS